MKAMARTIQRRSADFQSAVSPISNRPALDDDGHARGIFASTQAASLRYSRLEICATALSVMRHGVGAILCWSFSLFVSGTNLIAEQAPVSLTILSSNSQPPTVGMEGRMEAVLPQPGLTVKAPDRRAPMLLRIAYTRPHGTLTYYDLRYIGHVPGQFDLRNYLFTTNGTPATNLPALNVSVAGILPAKHNGWLEEQLLGAPSIFGGYRAVLVIVVVLWISALVPIIRYGRKPKLAASAAPVRRAPSFAERLRPLVERAASGRLSADEQAALERMLITHWQRRLGLSEANGTELISQLRQHAEAGALLRALEDWLHRRPGTVKVDVESALAPYRNLPADEPVEAVQ
jgi:hypothetical protein